MSQAAVYRADEFTRNHMRKEILFLQTELQHVENSAAALRAILDGMEKLIEVYDRTDGWEKTTPA